MRCLLIALIATLALAPAALAAKITATQDGASLIVTAKLATPGTYAATCEFPGLILGTNGQPTNRKGKLVLRVLLGPATGPYTCKLRSDLDNADADPATLKGGKPAIVTGVAE